MKFELGGYYKHVSKEVIHVCAVASTYNWDTCLISENPQGELRPIDPEPDATINWEPISKSEYLRSLT